MSLPSGILVVLSVLHGLPGEFPLAAALVVGGDLVVVDVPSRSATPVPLGGLVPEEADLSPDKKLIAFNARRGPGEPARLFLYHRAEQRLEELSTAALGDHRFPRFSDKGKRLYFVAAKLAAPGGSENPGRLFRMQLAGRAVEEVTTPKGACAFSPVGLSKDRVVHVSTHCFLGFELALTDAAMKTSVVGSVSGPRAELASSFDGESVLYTSEVPEGTGFFRWSKGKSPQRLAVVSVTESRLQPRFVCPKDAVFYNAGQVWALDTKSGRTESLFK